MKKYLLKLTALVLLVGAFVGCSEDKVFYDEAKGPTLARFVDASRLMGVTEKKKEKTYAVQASTISTVDRKITVSIDTTGAKNINDFIEVVAAESFIPAGKYDGTIKVRFKKQVADLPADPITALLVLEAVDGASVEPNNKRLLLTIFKDCDYDATLVGTSFTADVTADKFGTSFPGMAAPSYEPVVTVKDNVISLSTLWGPNFVGTVASNPSYNGNSGLLNPGKLTIDTAENTITVIGTGSDPSWVINGTGTYDACKNIIKYTFTQGIFTTAPPFTVTVTLTPKQ